MRRREGGAQGPCPKGACVLHSGMDRTGTPDLPGNGLRPPRARALRTITALVLREMGSTYGRSPGGYLWAILEPVGAIIVLSLVFSVVVRAPSLGTSFILFYATGYLAFDFYMGLSNKIARALNYSRSLLAYPAVTWLDAVLARFLLNAITDVMVMVIVFVGVLMTLDTQPLVDIVPAVTSVVLAGLLGLGVGMVNSLLFGLFPLWVTLWSIVTRPLFLASGIFFIYEDMPPIVQDIIWWNPLIHITGLMRQAFYPTYHATYVSEAYCLGVALVLIAAGLLFLRAYYKLALER